MPDFASLRRRVAGWIAPETRSADVPTVGSSTWGDFWGWGGQTKAGPVVNERTALGIAALWRAVNLIAGKVAALSLEVRDADDRGGSTPAEDHPVYRLLHDRPNPKQSAFHFRQALIGHVLTGGVGYASIQWNGRASYPVAFHLLNPRNVEVIEDAGSLRYKLLDSGRILAGSDVIHLRGLSYDGIRGYSPVTIAREQLATTLAQQEFEGATFGNGARIGGHLEIPGSMNEVQIEQQRRNWNKVHQGAGNAGNVGILTGGMKWVQTSFSPADAQMILARGFSVLEVARVYGVPPHKLGVMEGATVGNAEQQDRQFYADTILPLLAGIEGELDMKLFSTQERNAGLFVRHDSRPLLRGDIAAQTTLSQALRGMGATSINETRLEYGYAPLPDPAADWHWVSTNNEAPIETMGDDPPPTQPASNADGQDAQPEPGKPADESQADDARNTPGPAPDRGPKR